MKEEIEELINQDGLISQIDYDEHCKNSFFEVVSDWNKHLSKDLKIEKWNAARGMGFSLTYAYLSTIMPDKRMRVSKQVYSVVASLTNFLMAPFIGMWAYRPDHRTIIRGNDFQRLVACVIQGDLLVHEYLHVYEHSFHDYLLRRDLIKKQPNPASIIEPNQLGFRFYPPSKKFLRRFEKKILRKLDKRGQILF